MTNEQHLRERLIEAHRTLQQSVEYLLDQYADDYGRNHNNRVIDELRISMVNLENAIELLKNTP